MSDMLEIDEVRTHPRVDELQEGLKSLLDGLFCFEQDDSQLHRDVNSVTPQMVYITDLTEGVGAIGQADRPPTFVKGDRAAVPIRTILSPVLRLPIRDYKIPAEKLLEMLNLCAEEMTTEFQKHVRLLREGAQAFEIVGEVQVVLLPSGAPQLRWIISDRQVAVWSEARCGMFIVAGDL